MNRIFRAGEFFSVPDGTQVAEILSTLGLAEIPGEAGLSIARGRIDAGKKSWVHVHPIVTQATLVTTGALAVRMKGPNDADFYDLALEPGDAALTPPGTLFQLRGGGRAAEVLYMVTPPFVYRTNAAGDVVYNDAVLVSESWPALAAAGYRAPALEYSVAEARRRRREFAAS